MQPIGLIRLNGRRIVMAIKYNELRSLVRNWSNRDDQVLSDSVIESALKYSADEAFTKLQIPQLEKTKYFLVTEDGSMPNTTNVDYNNVAVATIKDSTMYKNTVTLDLPEDLISFIVLRVSGKAQYTDTSLNVDSVGNPIVTSTITDRVANEKLDIRTFYDNYADKSSDLFWARQGAKVLISGNINEDDVIELHYYSKLAPLNAREDLPNSLTLAQAQLDTDNYEVITALEYSDLDSNDASTYKLISGSYVRAVDEKANWLRDDNERVLLFGALHRVFDYLQEDDQSVKYFQRFTQAIDELNKEEKVRKVSGGNIKVNFSSHLI